MKQAIKTLLILIIPFSVFAQNQITVALNMDECTSCYNSLKYLKDLDTGFGLRYVFLKSYKMDSDLIQETFRLPERGEFIWDDKVNEQYLLEGYMSSINFEGIDENHNPLSFSVRYQLDGKLVQFFNKLNNEVDTFEFDKDIFSMTNAPLVYNGYYVYAINTFRNTVTRGLFDRW